MNQHGALALGGHNEHHGQKVRRKARPRGICYGHNGAVDEGLDFITLLLRDEDVVPPLLQLHAQTAETLGDDAELFVMNVFDGQRTACDGGKAYEGADLNHIGKDGVGSSAKLLYSGDGKQVGAYSINMRTHLHKHTAELLHIRLAGRIVDGCNTGCESGCHYDIGRTGDGSFVKKHTGAVKGARSREVVGLHICVIDIFGAQLDKTFDMGIHPAAADFVSTRLRKEGFAQAGEQRSGYHHGAAELCAFAYKLGAADVVELEFGGFKGIIPFGVAGHLHTHSAEQVYEVERVEDFRHVADMDRGGGEQYRAQHLKGFILSALRSDGAA